MRVYIKYWLFLLAPLAVVGWLIHIGHSFIGRAIDHDPLLNYSILGAILAGAAIAMARHYGLWREASRLERFLRGGAPDLTGAHGGMAATLALIGRIPRPIANDIDQRALNEELEHLREDYEARLALPQFLASFMVALGLFGTFVGLLETLNATNDLLRRFGGANAGDIGQVVTGIIGGMRGPLGGMATSFSASLFGLLGSLLLGAMLMATQAMVAHILARLRRYVDEEVVVVGARAGVSGGVPSMPKSILDMLDRMARQQQSALDLFALGRQAEIDAHARLEQLVDKFLSIEAGTANLGVHLGTLAATVEKQGDAIAALMAQTKALLDGVQELPRVGSLLIQSSGAAQEAVRTAVDAVEKLVAAQTEALDHERAAGTALQKDLRSHVDVVAGRLDVETGLLHAIAGSLDVIARLQTENGDVVARLVQRQDGQSLLIKEQLASLATLYRHAVNQREGGGPVIREFVRSLHENRDLLTRDLTQEIRALAQAIMATPPSDRACGDLHRQVAG